MNTVESRPDDSLPPPYTEESCRPAKESNCPPQNNATVSAAVVGKALSDQPMTLTCGQCGSTVLTETKLNPGGLTWLMCTVIALLGCWMGCCLIPFFVDKMQDVEHLCPNCKAKLGTYKRI